MSDTHDFTPYISILGYFDDVGTVAIVGPFACDADRNAWADEHLHTHGTPDVEYLLSQGDKVLRMAPDEFRARFLFEGAAQ